MKVGFLTFEQFQGKKNIGSSRIRCDWLIKYWGDNNAERFRYGAEYDVVVYQKAYFWQHAQAYKGIKILDLCDADWLHWGYHLVHTMRFCDAVTCSTEEIARYIVNLTDKPVWVIPDRIDFDVLKDKKPKVHKGDLKKILWYGYSDNFEMLDPAIPAIKSRGLELIVISNKPYSLPAYGRGIDLTNYTWSPDTWVDDIMKGDLVINPKSKKGRFRFKSDNKTIQAWALGLPVAMNDRQLDQFITQESREKEQRDKLALVQKEFNVTKSVSELKDLIKSLAP